MKDMEAPPRHEDDVAASVRERVEAVFDPRQEGLP